jgi:hypothetical protein
VKRTICITLDPKLVEHIERDFPLVKRSNAIEHLLKKALSKTEA